MASASGLCPSTMTPWSTTPSSLLQAQQNGLQGWVLSLGVLRAGGQCEESGASAWPPLVRPHPHPRGKNHPFHGLLLIWLIRANLLWIQTVFTVTGRQAGDSGEEPHKLPGEGRGGYASAQMLAGS